MESLLLPHYRNDLEIPQTLYVCKKRYDGGPFLSYPERVGKAHFGSVHPDSMPFRHTERANPTPVPDMEDFIQTWLFFGLIAEFLGGTAELPVSPVETESQPPNTILDHLYTLVVEKHDKPYVVLTKDGLQKFLELARPRFPGDHESRVARFNLLQQCMFNARAVWAILPPDFNHTIKYSIGAVAEVLLKTVQNFLSGGSNTLKNIFPSFSEGYFNADVKRELVSRGWCPSEVEKAQNTIDSLQLLHVARMMDKSLPKRNHSLCTDVACNACQINMSDFKLQHTNKECLCGQLFVNPDTLTQILKDGQIPLLRLVGNLDNMEAEVIPSGKDTPFIAISHVWADGLGNPSTNSLHRCKLLQLRNFLNSLEVSNEKSGPPFLWLDTLCCPAEDGDGKQLAIAKLQTVYRLAQHVLVLDAGLMAYDALPQDLTEKLVRIFTSSWMRRLWTLQEGALPSSIYFQFGDKAVSFNELNYSIMETSNSIRHLNAYNYVSKNFDSLKSFFHPNSPGVSNLASLDETLLYRSVSVPTDEALCIGTLMHLDVSAILKVEPKEDRMQKVWELIASSKEGISSAVIFFDGPKIGAQGFRWALQSLLTPPKSIFAPTTRRQIWEVKTRGTTDRRGLRVEYPGFRIFRKEHNDGKPRNPWPGMKRIGESVLLFRDLKTAQWYEIGRKEYILTIRETKTEEERLAYEKLSLFPLHDLADSGESVLLMSRPGDETSRIDIVNGLFGPAAKPNIPDLDANEGITIRVENHVIVSKLCPDKAYIFQILDKLALELRSHPVTDKHLLLYNQLKKDCNDNSAILAERMKEDEGFKASLETVRQMFKDTMSEVISHDERFTKAVQTYYTKDTIDYVWVMIPDWSDNDYLGEALEDDQVWFVD